MAQAQYPQQGVPVMTQQPLMRVRPETARPGFAHHSQNRLGILQIICGMLVAVIAVAMIFFQSSLFFFGYGIWTGLFFIIAGALAVSSSKSKNTCPIVGCLIMCVFCLMAATVVIAFGAIGLGVDLQVCALHDVYRREEWCEDNETARTVNIGLQAVNLLTGLFEWIVALVQMIICCRALCCAPSQPGAVYYAAAPQQIQVQAQYPQTQQPTYPQYQPQQHAQPGFQGQHAPQGQHPQQGQQYASPHGSAYPGMQPYAGASNNPYQPTTQPGGPPVCPQLPPQYDDGRPPPYNPMPHGPSASAPAYGDAGTLPTKQ